MLSIRPDKGIEVSVASWFDLDDDDVTRKCGIAFVVAGSVPSQTPDVMCADGW